MPRLHSWQQQMIWNWTFLISWWFLDWRIFDAPVRCKPSDDEEDDDEEEDEDERLTPAAYKLTGKQQVCWMQVWHTSQQTCHVHLDLFETSEWQPHFSQVIIHFENTNVGTCRIGMQMFYQTKLRTLWLYILGAFIQLTQRKTPELFPAENINSRT